MTVVVVSVDAAHRRSVKGHTNLMNNHQTALLNHDRPKSSSSKLK